MPWRDISSQPLVCDLLRRSLKNGRTHHGYILSGEETETEPVALAFAQALNCEKDDGDACGKCESCLAIAAGRHPDVYETKAESRSRRIVIKQVRELERSVFLKASHARTKIAIIHTADRLQPEAQDAFLKTLEEPPPKTMFLLLTEEPQQLRDTILSRCLSVRFRPGRERRKTENEQKVEAWLEAFAAPVPAAESAAIRAYGFVGNVLGMLKEMRDEKLKATMELLDDPSNDHLEAVQRARLEEQLEAQAHADYLHERSRILRHMLEWYHARSPGSRAPDILERLSSRLNRNVNESLAWEIAMLELSTQPGLLAAGR